MLRSVLAVCLLLLMSLARAETAVPVRVATTTLQPLVEVVPVSGSVSTARVATLSAEVEGRVSGLPVEEGQRIEKGALLMTLDDELVQRDLDRDRAEVARLGSTLDDAQRRLSEARYQHAFFRSNEPGVGGAIFLDESIDVGGDFNHSRFVRNGGHWTARFLDGRRVPLRDLLDDYHAFVIGASQHFIRVSPRLLVVEPCEDTRLPRQQP